jgi:hypothetical protein
MLFYPEELYLIPMYTTKITVLPDFAPSILVEKGRRFRGKYSPITRTIYVVYPEELYLMHVYSTTMTVFWDVVPCSLVQIG